MARECPGRSLRAGAGIAAPVSVAVSGASAQVEERGRARAAAGAPAALWLPAPHPGVCGPVPAFRLTPAGAAEGVRAAGSGVLPPFAGEGSAELGAGGGRRPGPRSRRRRACCRLRFYLCCAALVNRHESWPGSRVYPARLGASPEAATSVELGVPKPHQEAEARGGRGGAVWKAGAHTRGVWGAPLWAGVPGWGRLGLLLVSDQWRWCAQTVTAVFLCAPSPAQPEDSSQPVDCRQPTSCCPPPPSPVLFRYSLALRWSVPAVPLGPAPPCLGERGPASVEPPAAGGGAWPSRSLEFGTFSAWLSALGPCSCLWGLPPPCPPVPPLPVGTGPSVLAQSPCRWGLV